MSGIEANWVRLVVTCGICVSTATIVRADAPYGLALTLTATDIISIRPGQNTKEKDFYVDWGQFEVRIPRKSFPIPAPNCKGPIILRMPGEDPSSPDAPQMLRAHFAIFHRLWKLVRTREGRVTVEIAPSPYMERSKGGEYTLQYCNAYIKR
jgi:hypothetical protein